MKLFKEVTLSAVIICLTVLLCLISCGDGSGDNAVTTDIDTVSGETEVETDIAETQTETAVETTAEETTEEETTVPVADALTFPVDADLSKFISAKGATVNMETAEDAGNYININITRSASASFSFDYTKCASYLGLVPLTTDEARYMVMSVKTGNKMSGKLTLRTVVSSNGDDILYSKAALYEAKEWTDIVFDMSDLTWTGTPTTFKFEFSTNLLKDDTFAIRSIKMYPDVNSMLKSIGLDDFCLRTDSGVSSDDNDPLRHVQMSADKEDESVTLWFDQISEKVMQAKFTPTDRRGYTMYMAKNESECCQFFLTSNAKRTYRIEVDPLTNENGDVLESQIMYQYYHKVDGVMTPDGLPPLTGPIEVKARQSQGFVVQATTKKDTAAGKYSALIHVYDGETGDEIKRAPICVNVWDFSLTDETIMRTAFGLYSKQVKNGWPDDFDKTNLYKNCYDFLLKYRVNCLDLPCKINSEEAKTYLADPRVNTVRIKKFDGFTAPDVPQEQLDKIIFYIVDEPDSDAKIKSLYEEGKKGDVIYPQYRLVAPFYCNHNLNDNAEIDDNNRNSTMDQIEYMKQTTKIWCVKFEAFTPRRLKYFSNAFYLQSEWQDAQYGLFEDRMKNEVVEGDELWAYVCCTPMKPFCNWQLNSDGIETIISFWQCKMLDVTGMLDWCVNYWNVDANNHDTMTNVLTAPGYYWGDGMLIYSGAPFGLDTPISTIRLENLRDGIEDYQMLCMLEDALGEEAADEIVSLVTTSVITYTTDDDYLHSVRILLGNTLEKALGSQN